MMFKSPLASFIKLSMSFLNTTTNSRVTSCFDFQGGVELVYAIKSKADGDGEHAVGNEAGHKAEACIPAQGSQHGLTASRSFQQISKNIVELQLSSPQFSSPLLHPHLFLVIFAVGRSLGARLEILFTYTHPVPS